MKKYDDFLLQIGGFGRYQRQVIFLVLLAAVLTAFPSLDFVLTTASPSHWCKAPEGLQNVTEQERKVLTIPRRENGEYEKCRMFNLTTLDDGVLTEYMYSTTNKSYMNFTTKDDMISCSTWDYSTTIYKRTLITRWNLVCGREAFAATFLATFAVGRVVGSIVAGTLADRFGRRPIFLILFSTVCVTGLLSAFAPEPISFCVLCFFKGFAATGCYMPAFILLLELISPPWRIALSCFAGWAWDIGHVITALVSWLTRDWFIMTLCLYIPCFPFIALFVWFTPESPRWLLQTGRTDQAKKIMKQMARVNGVEWREEFEDVQPEKIETNQVTCTQMTKSDTMVVITIICCFMWFTCNATFYGLIYGTTNLVGDVYLNFLLSGLVEIPAYATLWLVAIKVGRRIATIVTFCIAAAALLITLAIPEDYSIITTVLSMIGKFAITITFGLVYVHTPEMYPTEYRTTGIGISNMAGRVGTIVAPYMALLGTVSTREVPLALFGVLAGISGFSALFLPETKNRKLPETMDDVRLLQADMLSCSQRKPSPQQMDAKETELEDFIGKDSRENFEVAVNGQRPEQPTEERPFMT